MCLQKEIPPVRTFYDTDECLRYLRSVRKQQVFLVISRDSPLPDHLITAYMTLRYVVGIYDYGWIGGWRKYCSALHSLADFDTPITTLLPLSDVETIRDGDRAGQRFIVHQLLIKLFLDLPSSDHAKEDFVNYCLEIFAGDDVYLRSVREFNVTYTSDQAIRWYTKCSFVTTVLCQRRTKCCYRSDLSFGSRQ